MLAVHNATFSYGNKMVFSDINFKAKEGDFYCVLGPNGCGKTTLLKCLAGILSLNKGIIYLEGVALNSLDRNAVARLVGYVMQEQDTVFPFSVRQMVAVGRAPYIGTFASPSEKDMIIVDEMIEKIGIGELSDKKYTELSGGERQLVLIARVLVQQPKILLMDEPASHLDFKNQEKVMRLVKKLTQSGITVIMTTHFPNHAFAYADKVALIYNGEILADGDTKSVMTEKNLSIAYEMPITIYSVQGENNREYNFCVSS